MAPSLPCSSNPIREARCQAVGETPWRAGLTSIRLRCQVVGELTKLERDEHIAEWVRLTEEKGKLAQLAPVSPKGGRGNEGGINAAVRERGIDRTQAQRAVKIAGITDEAKAAAREAGVDNNQSALLITANESPCHQSEHFPKCPCDESRPPFIATASIDLLQDVERNGNGLRHA